MSRVAARCRRRTAGSARRPIAAAGVRRRPPAAASCLPEERFEQAIDLEWPIHGLDPLSFVLGRLIEPLAAHLDRRGRGAAVLHVRLHFVTRAVHERALQLPAPIKDARTLRTLALLDLERIRRPPPSIGSSSRSIPRRRACCSFRCSRVRCRRRNNLHADGPPLGADGRRPLRLAGRRRYLEPGAFAMKPFAPEKTEQRATESPRH